jgi:mRNA-degrading endonuclease toxin of MazEF toxin-antitoxin module
VRRGEVWRYQPVAARPGQPTLRLIVSTNAVNGNDGIPVVLALHIVDADPQSLLAAKVGDHGWARALSLELVMRSRLVERVDVADNTTMEAVGTALRAAMDL